MYRNYLFGLLFLCLCFACNGKGFSELERKNLVATTIIDKLEFSGGGFSLVNAEAKGILLDFSNLNGQAMIQHGHCWSKQENPTLADANTRLGARNELGDFFSNLTNLEFDSTYFIRAYIQTNEEVIYSDVFEFLAVPSNLPVAVVESISVSNITPTTATARANISDTGVRRIVAHGHCWADTPNPTLENERSDFGQLENPALVNTDMPDLSPATTYYVRAYTIDTFGVVVYGTENIFNTSDE